MKVPQSQYMDSHRAECFGLYGGVYSLTQLMSRNPPTMGMDGDHLTLQLQVGCDNISALRSCFDNNTYPYIGSKKADFDIIYATRTIMPGDTSFSWRHVKGHQTGDLDIWGILNNLVDATAGEVRVAADPKRPPSNVRLPGEKWQIFTGDQKIYKNIRSTLYDTMSSHSVIPFWIKKGRVTQIGHSQVDWNSLGCAMSQVQPTQRRWITKRAARECGANAVLFKRKTKNTDADPLCGECETVLHVLKCQNSRALQQWNLSLATLKLWLEDHDTDADIIISLISGLQTWRNGDPPLSTANSTLLQAQDIVGWDGILEGCFSLAWGNAQQQYWVRKDSQRKGHTWMVKTIRRVWLIAWELWQHRNEIEHANDAAIEKIHLDKLIAEQIDIGHQNIDAVEHILRTPDLLDIMSNSTNEGKH